MDAHEDGSITEKKFFPLKLLFSTEKKIRDNFVA